MPHRRIVVRGRRLVGHLKSICRDSSDRAVEIYQASKPICRDLSDRAIEFYQASRSIYRDLSDRVVEFYQAFQSACRDLSDRALEFYQACAAAAQAPIDARLELAGASSVESLESRTLLSTSWYVAPYGSDSNGGSYSAPFRTIQRAANVANAGDHVEIRAGTYHEDVVPAHSGSAGAPITFEAYNGEHVTVTGADLVGGWSYSGSGIYHASMPWTLGEGNDEVFVDGRMINEARWPNTSTDLSHPTLAHAQNVVLNGSTATLYDSALNQPSGFWNGAIIHIAPGQAWIAQTGTVTRSGPGYIVFNYQPIDSYELPKAGNAYYLTGSLNALDAGGEWYRSSNGQLYAKMPSSDNPASHDVEAKHRQFAFDVSNDSYITIQNVNIFAATINSNAYSRNLTINHITASYISQFLKVTWGWDVPATSGIVLNGPYSLLENSVIQYSAGDGVYIKGYGSRVTNDIIHDVDYSAGDAAAIRAFASGLELDHNTIYYAGRDGIQHEGTGNKILNNNISYVGQQTTEAGGIYTVHTNGGGTEIAYNKISSFHSGGYGETGLFFDNSSPDYNVHNNVVSDTDTALKMNGNSTYMSVWNNTLSGSWYAVFGDYKGSWGATKVVSNVFFSTAILGSGAYSSNNTYSYASGRGAGDFSSGASISSYVPAPVASAPAPTPAPAPAPTPAPTTSTTSTSSTTARAATQTFSALKYDAVYGLKYDNFSGLGYASNGYWAEYKNINFGTSTDWFGANVSGLSGWVGSIQIRLDSPTGALAGTLKVNATGAWNNYVYQYTQLATKISGVHNLYLVFVGSSKGIANIESFRFA